jgi:hypothetical protein
MLAWYKSQSSQTACAVNPCSAVRDPNPTDNQYSIRKKQDSGFRIRITLMHHFDADPDTTFDFNTDPNPAAHQALEFLYGFGAES